MAVYVPGRYAIDGLGCMESVGIHQEASSANTRGTFHVLSSLLCPILLSFIYPTHLRYGVFGLMVKSSRLHLAAERKAEIAAPRQQRLKELRASGSLPKLVRVGKPAQKVQKSEPLLVGGFWGAGVSQSVDDIIWRFAWPRNPIGCFGVQPAAHRANVTQTRNDAASGASR